MSRWHLPVSVGWGGVRLEVWNLEVDNGRGGRMGDVVLYNTHPWYCTGVCSKLRVSILQVKGLATN